VIDSLLGTFGLFGGAFLVAFCAGMFPIISIELFLIGIGTWAHPTSTDMVWIVLLAAIGHQIAKTICYYAGYGALEKANDKLRARVDKLRHKIDRWNKRPKLIMFIASTTGIPPLYVLAFIARPLMNMRIAPFTLIVFSSRILRYAVLLAAPQLIGAG
jgi:membrane protein YqaA with SNARE-associated domain